MTAPTEAEIREAISERLAKYPGDNHIRTLVEAIEKAFDTIAYVELDEQGQYDFGTPFLSDIWADLRPSEASRLGQLVRDGSIRALKVLDDALRAEVVAAAMQFAAEHPDASRVERELVTA